MAGLVAALALGGNCSRTFYGSLRNCAHRRLRRRRKAVGPYRDRKQTIGDLRLDGARVHLTSKEYQILELLSLRKGTSVTKEMFLTKLYGGMDEPEIKIIDVFICKLRKKLANASGGKDYIETIWGRGHMLRKPPDEEAVKISA